MSDDSGTQNLRKAAEAEDAEAQFELGWAYSNGLGVEKNDLEAAKWYNMSALQGHMRAQYSLGLMYSDVLGVRSGMMSKLQNGVRMPLSRAIRTPSFWWVRCLSRVQGYCRMKPTPESG